MEQLRRVFQETRRLHLGGVAGCCGRCGAWDRLVGELREVGASSVRGRRVMLLCNSCFEYHCSALRPAYRA